MSSRNSYVMLLGASMMQLPALKAIENLGYSSLVVDANPNAPLMALADQRAVIDLKNVEELSKFLDEFIEHHTLSGIFTAGTDFSYIVSTLAERYSLPAHTRQSAIAATDKLRMRTLLHQHGVNVPRFMELTKDNTTERQLESALEQADFLTPYDVVVKPVDSMGARGVIRAKNVKEILLAAESARVYSRSGKVIVEQYLDGPELSVDALVEGDQIYIHGIADRHIYYPPYFIEMGHTIPSEQSSEVLEAVITEFKKGIRALGLSHGAAKGDIKVTSNGVFIGEIAGRLSGGYMSGWTYPFASGVPVTELAVQLAVGNSIQENEANIQEKSLYCAERAIISIPGVIADLLFVEDARMIDGVQEIFLRAKVGDTVVFPKNNVEKAGNIIAVADNYRGASEIAESARKIIFLRLEADNAVTRDFLFGRRDTHLQSAFISGKDFSGHTREEILQRYEHITGHSPTLYKGDRIMEFERAIERGGLQGAVWYYDTFGTIVS
ncbi:ATP-grasp domain-containing protein [Entomospira entomophila]|uniref:ATP-grasp domain-containing protein n=1 Tax=Entomospira entomophila TaxID=2719988 RepID=A0A968GCS9_9SPIO|nr:ATP-grasp domain-containing protein [Entomospira entomophilus]NIZ41081.1 ATP-grasp domain-containing protein [Entomospira entomophilus]WDI35290.1 ATP-grasp domain-containing protein [Entomospira entomophilus]